MYVYICIYKHEVTYLYDRITLYNNNNNNYVFYNV